MQSVCTLSVPSQYLSVLIRSRVQGPCVTSKSTVSASALGLAIYAAAHALLEENLSPPRLASTRLPAGIGSERVVSVRPCPLSFEWRCLQQVAAPTGRQEHEPSERSSSATPRRTS